jgi:hypothetical protein
MTLKIKEVLDKQGQKDFLQVPFPLYASDPHWVAPLFIERFDHLNTKKNPYFEHAEAALFVAYREGRPVGRISAQKDALRLKHHADGAGQFGFFECEDRQETANALFDSAAGWLRARGLASMQGPFNFSINDEMGLLVAGYDSPPNMMMGHARPYYLGLLERAGFAKLRDVVAYRNGDAGELPPLLKKIYDRAMASGDISFRPLDLKQIDRDIAIIMDIFNDAWSNNWGFVPFTAAELGKLGKDLKMLVTGDYVSIASYRGEPAAMVVTLPNLNEWIAGLNGRLMPFGWARLLPRVLAKRPRSIRMPLMGVKKKLQDSLVGSALAIGVIQQVRAYHIKRGVKECEMSWVLEDNKRLRHMLDAFGGEAYKTYRIFERPL